MRAIVIAAMITGCASGGDACYARSDAAAAICRSLCARADRCPMLETDMCAASCADIICSGEACSACVADEERVRACVAAVGDLECTAADLPEICAGALE